MFYLLAGFCQYLKSHFNLYSTPLSSERERIQEGGVKQRTTSLWSMINSHLEFYRNPFYHHVPHSLSPVPSMRYMKLWKSLYCRWNPSMRPQVKYFSLFLFRKYDFIALVFALKWYFAKSSKRWVSGLRSTWQDTSIKNGIFF